MKIYSFPRGGLTFDDATAPQKKQAVNAFLPAFSVIPMGDSSTKVYPLVMPGEMVREGMLIGRAAAAGAANVHTSIPGRVIRKVSWKDESDTENDALLIRMEGSFERLGRKEEVFPWTGLNGYDLQRIISDYGVVEMEGSGRPLSEMISACRKANNKLTLVIRCILDDPWLVADYALCKDRINEIIDGAQIVAKACFKVSHIIFAVSYREKELGKMFLNNAGKLDLPYSTVLTSCRYPQRNNRELEIALRQYEKKEGLDLGSFLILGPSVLAAAYDAVKYKKPILDRYVAVGGSAVKTPQIMKVRIGTRIGEIIDQCGGFTEKPYKIITGSVLSGREVAYLDEPVRKTCYAIIAMSKSHVSYYSQQNCINCGECRAVCPVGLDPQYIYKQINMPESGNFMPDEYPATGCHGCGCCKIVCPSSLPLSELILKRNTEQSKHKEVEYA